MDQHTAVKLAMLDLKCYDNFPPNTFPLIKRTLERMWCAGYDYRAIEFSHSNKEIGQFTREGKMINSFKSLQEAHRVTNFSYSTIQKATKRGTPTKHGHIWKYL